MSLPPPHLPLRTPRADDFIAPMAKASLLVCAASSLWFAVQMLALPLLLTDATRMALWESDWWTLLPEPVKLGIAHAQALTAAACCSACSAWLPAGGCCVSSAGPWWVSPSCWC